MSAAAVPEYPLPAHPVMFAPTPDQLPKAIAIVQKVKHRPRDVVWFLFHSVHPAQIIRMNNHQRLSDGRVARAYEITISQYVNFPTNRMILIGDLELEIIGHRFTGTGDRSKTKITAIAIIDR